MVLLVHTFLNNGYYREPVEGSIITIFTFFRQFAMICVPLFIILTGYLQCGKEIAFNKKYVFKLAKFIVPYILITTIAYCVFVFCGIEVGKPLPLMLIEISESGYAWYLEMYIGLYLLIPFINTGWNNIKTKKEKQSLVIVMFVLCYIPNLLIAFRVHVIDYWIEIYPLAYYLMGLYLKDYGLNFSNKIKGIILLMSSTISFAMTATIFKANVFDAGNGYNNPLCFISAVIVFDLLSQINTTKFKEKTKRKLAKTADIIFPAYLGSYLIDIFLYQVFAMTYLETVEKRLLWSPVLIIISAICSLSFGKIVSIISNKILSIRRK